MDIKKIIPHPIAILLMAILALGLFAPTVFENKVLSQHDNLQARGMQGEINPFLKEQGRIPLWTNQVFVGMPTYQLVNPSNNNWIADVGYYVLRLGQPVDSPIMMLVLMMAMIYVSLLLLETDYKIAALGALSFGLMTSNILYIEAGHSVKMYALAFVAPMLASVVATYRGKWIMGSSLFGFFFALNLAANHVQITYYTFFVIAVMGVGFLISLLSQKKMGLFIKATMALGLASALAVGTSISTLWTTYEYADESTRGKSELAAKANQSGLDKEYALGLSFEKKEALTLMLPYFYGGSQTQADAFAGKNKKTNTQQYLNKAQRDPQAVAKLSQIPEQVIGRGLAGYWGSQTMVGGPIYFGAVLCLLFLMGLFLVRGVVKWVLAISMGLLIVLAWGKFFPLTDFLFDNFPMYNKFRDVKMTLMVGQILVLFMGGLALKEILYFDIKKHENSLSAKLLTAMKRPVTAANLVLLGAGIAVLLCVFALLYSLVGSPTGPYDADMVKAAPELVSALQADRLALIRSDALTSLAFILLASGLAWFIARQAQANYELAGISENTAAPIKIISHWMLIGGLLVLSSIDLIRVNKNYLDKDSFRKKEEVREVPETQEDKMLAAQDNGKPAHETHYRVLDYRYGSPSQNAMGGYKHKIIGGYHAAKPLLFQELVERYPDLDASPSTFLQQHRHLAEMLNARYVLTGQGAPLPLQTCGTAWFVNNVQLVENADAELDSIGNFNPRTKAFVQKQYASHLAGLNNVVDSASTIRLTEYHPEKMVYSYKTAVESFVVFSEMYFPPQKGWNVYIDNNPVEGGFIKANFLLRGLRVPAGEHTIEMRFEPKSFFTGETIALICSILVLLGLVGGLFVGWKESQKKIEIAE